MIDHKYSRFDYYKLYKILCKRFHCLSLNYGFLTKADEKRGCKVIWAETAYGTETKVPLFVQETSKLVTLRKNINTTDIQKEIVKKILKELEKHTISAGSYKIAKNRKFDADLIKFDLAVGGI